MTKIALFGSAILVVIGVMLVQSADTPKGTSKYKTNVYTNAMDLINAQTDEINALSGLLYELAAERYAANTNSNRKWVLTYHQGRKIRRYTDGEYTVISLPIVEPRDESALRNYCTQYNSFSARAADLKVQEGEYSEAKELYQLLHHFERGDLKEDYEKKLMLLDKLKRKENVGVNLKQFMEISIPLGLGIDFSEIEKIRPTVVTNLLEVRLP